MHLLIWSFDNTKKIIPRLKELGQNISPPLCFDISDIDEDPPCPHWLGYTIMKLYVITSSATAIDSSKRITFIWSQEVIRELGDNPDEKILPANS